MTTGEPSPLVPTLRFPEFRGKPPWENRRGDELFDSISNRSAPPDLPVLAITQEHGAIPRDQIDYHVSVTAESVATYKEVCEGDFIISLRSFQGGIEYSRYHGICSPAYVILRRRGEGDDQFFRHLFKSEQFIQQLTRTIEGIRDGKMISYAQFSELLLPVPTLPEQNKIAECLDSLDELIATENRKLEGMGQHKQGLLQELFPRPGEAGPRLRFPEFHNAGEWGTRNLGSLVLIQSGSTPSKENPAFWDGSIPWVSAKDMKRLFLEDTQDHISIAALDGGVKLVPAGTLLMLTRGMTLLRDVPICMSRREMSFNQDVKGLRPKTGVNGLFLAFALLGSKQRLLEMVDIAGHGTGKLNTDELQAFELSLPQSAEQQRVAACLSSLDEMLTAQSRRVDELTAHKQGLVQQLFPSEGNEQ